MSSTCHTGTPTVPLCTAWKTRSSTSLFFLLNGCIEIRLMQERAPPPLKCAVLHSSQDCTTIPQQPRAPVNNTLSHTSISETINACARAPNTRSELSTLSLRSCVVCLKYYRLPLRSYHIIPLRYRRCQTKRLFCMPENAWIK